MRILWIVNMVLPKVAKELHLKTSVSGGWLTDYADKLAKREDISLATMTYAAVEKDMDVEACGIRNFIFAGGGKRLLLDFPQTLKDCEAVLQAFRPDIIHIHGTEYSMGHAMLQVNKKYNVPVVLTIQGILTRISQEYYGGLHFAQLVRMGTLQEWIKGKTTLIAKKMFDHNAKRERKVLRSVKYVTGRTTWDKAVMLSINPELSYYRFNYNLREEFYTAPKWAAEEMNQHTIYMGASSYPLKGMHIVINALEIVKKKYPDVRLLVPGGSFKDGKPLHPNGYERYILQQIHEKNLDEQVYFLGGKSAQEVTELLRQANVCVVPSAMEGASATICEAMMIGTPCVCTYRGGMTDLLHDGETGFYYDFPEYSVLAERITALFEDDDLCRKFSAGAMAEAELRHDRNKNFAQLIEIYNDVIQKEKYHA